VSPPAPSSVLELVGIQKGFGATRAVDGVDLVVGSGEYLCILGPSGSGKSTLLRLVAGFEAPDEGTIRLAGERVEHLPPERRPVHTVFQGYALFPHLSVFENVAFGLRMQRVPPPELRERVEGALALVGLPDFGSRRPGRLSGGEQQRVALARALVNRPPLLLLDEPLAALDRKLRLRLQEELRGIQRDSGIAFLHVTHDQEEALRLGDRVAVMDGGRVLQVGAPDAVYRRPRTAFVADFLGSSNLVRGTLRGGAFPGLVLDGGEVLPLRAEGSAVAPEWTLLEGRTGEWALRPESIGVGEVPCEVPGEAPGGHGRAPLAMVPSAIVEGTMAVGGVQELRVRVGGLLLRVHLLADHSRLLPPIGGVVSLLIHPRDLVPVDG